MKLEELTLGSADVISKNVIACAQRNGFKPVSVSVISPSGEVIVSKIMDDCSRQGIPDIAYAKAYTCVVTKSSSRMFREKYAGAGDAPQFSQLISMVNITDGKMVPSAGGVLITNEAGKVIGAVGVSGASADEDEYCAWDGIKKSNFVGIKTVPENHQCSTKTD
jgi:uncharacterized protein GlcG (DUF336 family)